MITLDSIWQPATQQKIYRGLLQAHSFPGRVVDLTDELDGQAAALGVLAVLLDAASTLCDAEGVLTKQDGNRLEAKPAAADTADFLLYSADLAPPADCSPRLGDVYQPHDGATLILVGQSLNTGHDTFELTGPGIENTQCLALDGFHSEWFSRRERWVANYPMGIDLILCDDSQIAALPRTTHVKRNAADRNSGEQR